MNPKKIQCSITPQSKRYGILGYPLSHTLSPRMHNGLFSLHGIDAFYFPLEIAPESFNAMAPLLPTLFSGFNVTVPHKEAILPFLQDLSPEAKAIGAVNTVINKEGSLHGTNTDWIGFAESLEKDYRVKFKNKNVLILGAGGSAKACFYAALWKGASSITVSNRTVSRAYELISSCKENEGTILSAIGSETEKLHEAVSVADIFINTTTLGLKPGEKHFIDFSNSKNSAFAFDLIYSAQTDFLKKASQKGLKTGDGRGMLLRQGAHAFKLWTGIMPKIPAMAKFAGFSASPKEQGK